MKVEINNNNTVGAVNLNNSPEVGKVNIRTGPPGPTGSTGAQGIQGAQGIAGLKDWVVKTSNYFAENHDRLIANTSNGSFTITLPVNPAAGDYIQITDGYDWSANTLYVDPNGRTIENFSCTIDIDIKNITVEFIYSGYTWELTATLGARGHQGVQGAPGPQGAAGSIGAQGSPGTLGPQGAQGLAGAQGEPGPQGDAGATGLQGAQGADGAQGFQGEVGAQGDAGPQGAQGADGAQGFQGIDGAQGDAGPQGAQGVDGAQGFQGIDGAQGAQGYQGPQGVQGSQGIAGTFGGASFEYVYSTNTANSDPGIGYTKFNDTNLLTATTLYINSTDIQASNVYNYLQTIDDSSSAIKGTFKVSNTANSLQYSYFSITGNHNHFQNGSEWFAVPIAFLDGETSIANGANLSYTFTRTGDKGDTGAQGVQGAQGIQGSVGVQGFQGADGAQGPQGYQGIQGGNGAQGAQGYQGDDGVQGSQGHQGVQGAQGFQGSAGNAGSAGPQGEQGVQGAQGFQGAQGIQGAQGFQGTQGVQGSPGAQGAQGVQGNQGIQGAQGVQGATGPGADQALNTTSSVSFSTVTTPILYAREVFENVSSLSAATGVVSHNCANSHIFVHTSISANFTANFTSVTIPANNAVNMTLVLNQGATAYLANAVQLGGSAQTVNWQGGTAPTPNPNKKDIMLFSIVNTSGNYNVFGQLVTFG